MDNLVAVYMELIDANSTVVGNLGKDTKKQDVRDRVQADLRSSLLSPHLDLNITKHISTTFISALLTHRVLEPPLFT